MAKLNWPEHFSVAFQISPRNISPRLISILQPFQKMANLMYNLLPIEALIVDRSPKIEKNGVHPSRGSAGGRGRSYYGNERWKGGGGVGISRSSHHYQHDFIKIVFFFRALTLNRQIPPPFPQRTTKNDRIEGKLAPLIFPTTRLSKGDSSSSPWWDLLRGRPLGGVPFPKITQAGLYSGLRPVRWPSWGSCPRREMNTRDFANASLWPRISIFNKNV